MTPVIPPAEREAIERDRELVAEATRRTLNFIGSHEDREAYVRSMQDALAPLPKEPKTAVDDNGSSWFLSNDGSCFCCHAPDREYVRENRHPWCTPRFVRELHALLPPSTPETTTPTPKFSVEDAQRIVGDYEKLRGQMHMLAAMMFALNPSEPRPADVAAAPVSPPVAATTPQKVKMHDGREVYFIGDEVMEFFSRMPLQHITRDDCIALGKLAGMMTREEARSLANSVAMLMLDEMVSNGSTFDSREKAANIVGRVFNPTEQPHDH